MSIADLRREYTYDGLSEAEAQRDPLAQFARWFGDAVPSCALLASWVRVALPLRVPCVPGLGSGWGAGAGGGG